MKKQNTLKKIVIWTFIVFVFFFFIRTIITNWSRIQKYDFKLNILNFIISILILNLVVFYWGFLWRDIIYKLSKKDIPLKDSFYIQITSWLGRYMPGKVGIILAKFYHGKRVGLKNETVFFSTVYENIFQILASFFIGVSFLAYFFLKDATINLFIKISPIFFILILFIFIHPKVFFFIINFGLRLFKKKAINKKYFLTEKQILYYLFLYSFGIILNGLAFYLMINSVMPFNKVILSIGTISFAGVIGLLAIFAPSGIGIREGIIVLIFQRFMPLEIATLISLLSRLWVTIADLFLGLYLLIYKSYLKLIKKEKV